MEQKQYEALCGFMEHLTKDYNWYYDTPERRFEYSPGSIWLINPETKEWVVELEKGGRLWWYWDFHFNFKRYFNMERPDFHKFIKIWVEDVLNRGVSSTSTTQSNLKRKVEDVLNQGVSSTQYPQNHPQRRVEDVLNKGVTSTQEDTVVFSCEMEDVLNREIYIKDCMGVDGGIKNHYQYLMDKSFYDDFQNKVDERVIEHIFNTREK